MSRLRHLFPLLLLATLTLACSESSTAPGEEDELGHPPTSMVGSWTFQSATENGTPVGLAGALQWDPATTQARANFEANGTYWYEELDASGAQVWAEGGWVFVDPEGGTIEVNVQWDSDGSFTDQYELGYTLGGGVLTLRQVEGASTFVYTLGT